MRYIKPKIFDSFSCIGSDCYLTCCGRWEIDIDKITASYYNNVEGEFGERLKRCIALGESGEYHFVLRDNGECPLLNEKGLCDIYINLGKEHLCTTCIQYPRYSYVAGDTHFSGLYMSCPEAARIMLANEKLQRIEFSNDTKNIPNMNTIDWELFYQSMRVFKNSVDIAQNRSLKVRNRVALLVLFCFQFQGYVDQKKDPSGLISIFSNPDVYIELLNEMIISDRSNQIKLDFCFEFLKSMLRIVRLDLKAPDLNKLLNKYKRYEDISINEEKILSSFSLFDEPKEQIWQEQLVVYGLNRYFMEKFSKRQFYESFIFGSFVTYLFGLSVGMLYYFLWDKKPDHDWIVRAVSQISRITEHGMQLDDDFFNGYREKGMLSPDLILQLLS